MILELTNNGTLKLNSTLQKVNSEYIQGNISLQIIKKTTNVPHIIHYTVTICVTTQYMYTV